MEHFEFKHGLVLLCLGLPAETVFDLVAEALAQASVVMDEEIQLRRRETVAPLIQPGDYFALLAVLIATSKSERNSTKSSLRSFVKNFP